MKQVLIWNCPLEKLRKLQVLLIRLGLSWKAVSAEEQGKTLEELAELTEPSEAAEEFTAFTDEMMVMANLPQGKMTLLLNGMRQNKTVISLKAVMTETNRNWSSVKLYEEIRMEHDAMQKKLQSIHQNQ